MELLAADPIIRIHKGTVLEVAIWILFRELSYYNRHIRLGVMQQECQAKHCNYTHIWCQIVMDLTIEVVIQQITSM